MEQKCRFIGLLDEIGVREVEIGLPDGMAACAELADRTREHTYAIQKTALVPCYTARWQRQVDLAVEHGISRIDIVAPVSDHLLKDRDHYGLRAEDIGPRLKEVVDLARPAPLELGVGLIDACRTPLDRILTVVRPLRSLGVSRLVVYDSVGTMLPSEMTPFVAEIGKASGLPILIHCHNDYGLATANSLAAVAGGASAVDVAVNGVGGRAGNAALDEVALALENLCGVATGIDTSRLLCLARFVEEMTGLKNSRLKPIVGEYCFAHLPVMHIRCIAGGNPSAFEPFDPHQVGAERTYDFSLPVDHSDSVEPFIRTSGAALDPAEVSGLVTALRDGSDGGGWTEARIGQQIRKIESARRP